MTVREDDDDDDDDGPIEKGLEREREMERKNDWRKEEVGKGRGRLMQGNRVRKGLLDEC